NSLFYFANGPDLFAANGMTAATALTQGAQGVVDVAGDGTDVYWTTSTGSILRCSMQGCSNNPMQMVGGRSNPHGITLDGVNLYWTETNSGQVMKCLRSNCSGSLTPVITGQNQPYDIAVDANTIYWTNSGDGTVKKIAK